MSGTTADKRRDRSKVMYTIIGNTMATGIVHEFHATPSIAKHSFCLRGRERCSWTTSIVNILETPRKYNFKKDTGKENKSNCSDRKFKYIMHRNKLRKERREGAIDKSDMQIKIRWTCKKWRINDRCFLKFMNTMQQRPRGTLLCIRHQLKTALREIYIHLHGNRK